MSALAAEVTRAPAAPFRPNTHLSHEHSLALLYKLATDDGFRARYEQSPTAALTELGVPQETIAGLKASCTKPTVLANKSHFAEAHERLTASSAESCLMMIQPDARLDFGAKK